MEIIVGAELFDADMAERYGWINRALPPQDLDDFVDDLARTIASQAPGVVIAAKQAIDASTPDLSEALRVNNALLGQTFALPKATELTLAALEAGAQTREGEKQLEDLLADLWRARSGPNTFELFQHRNIGGAPLNMEASSQ